MPLASVLGASLGSAAWSVKKGGSQALHKAVQRFLGSIHRFFGS